MRDDKGNCYNNTIIERLFGYLKNESLTNVIHLTRDSMINHGKDYILYYSSSRLHSTLEALPPNKYDNPLN